MSKCRCDLYATPQERFSPSDEARRGFLQIESATNDENGNDEYLARCVECGRRWSIFVENGGHLPMYYWR